MKFPRIRPAAKLPGRSTTRISPYDRGSDIDNEALPPIVRQMLHLSGSVQEREAQARTALYWRYYDNTQYEPAFLADDKSLSAEEQRQKALYEGTKPLFNLIAQACDTDRDTTWNNARPVPYTAEEQELEDELEERWRWQGWLTAFKLGTLYSAATGKGYMVVRPGWFDGDPDAPSRIEAFSPDILTVLRDQHDRRKIIAAKIEYKYTEYSRDRKKEIGHAAMYQPNYNPPSLGTPTNWAEEEHIYTMVITEDWYYTFRDYALFDFDDNPSKFRNNLGRVPVFELPFQDNGKAESAPTFASIIPTLDAINELASFFGEAINANSDPVLLAYGISPKTKLTKEVTSDGTTVWYIPMPPPFGVSVGQAQPKIEYLEWKASSLPQLLEFLQMIVDDCRNALPELHLNRHDDKTANSGHAVSLQMQRFIQKNNSVREVQYPVAVEAIRLAKVADDLKEERLEEDELKERFAAARKKYKIKIQADPPLPADRQMLAQVATSNVDSGQWSRFTGRIMQGMTEKEAQAEEDRIKHEQDLELQFTMKMQKMEMELQMQMQQQMVEHQTQQQMQLNEHTASVGVQAADQHGQIAQANLAAGVQAFKNIGPIIGANKGSIDGATMLISQILGAGAAKAMAQGQGGIGPQAPTQQQPADPNANHPVAQAMGMPGTQPKLGKPNMKFGPKPKPAGSRGVGARKPGQAAKNAARSSNMAKQARTGIGRAGNRTKSALTNPAVSGQPRRKIK